MTGTAEPARDHFDHAEALNGAPGVWMLFYDNDRVPDDIELSIADAIALHKALTELLKEALR